MADASWAQVATMDGGNITGWIGAHQRVLLIGIALVVALVVLSWLIGLSVSVSKKTGYNTQPGVPAPRRVEDSRYGGSGRQAYGSKSGIAPKDEVNGLLKASLA